MKRIIFLSITSLLSLWVTGQKKELSYDSFHHFQHLGSKGISPDFRVIAYTVSSDEGQSDLFVQSTDNTWVREFERASKPIITSDSKFILFRAGSDSLGIFSILTRGVKIISGVKSFGIPKGGSGQWAAYLSPHSDSVFLMDLRKGIQRGIASGPDYFFSTSGNVLLVHGHNGGINQVTETLTSVQLPSLQKKILITTSGTLSHFTFDADGRQISFIRKADQGAGREGDLFYYAEGMDSATCLVGPSTGELPNGMTVGTNTFGYPEFSKDGTSIFFTLENGISGKSSSSSANGVSVTIWNAQDPFLASEREKQLKQDQDVAQIAIIPCRPGSKMVCLTSPGDRKFVLPVKPGADQALACSYKGNDHEDYWRSSARKDYFLVSLKDGSRRSLVSKLLYDLSPPSFSPGGKYVVWYDVEKMSYFTFNLKNGLLINISKDIPAPLYNVEPQSGAIPQPFGIAAWGENDASLYLYDKFDIWQVDPDGIKPTQNITAGYGREHKISFRYINLNGNYDEFPVVRKGEKILLSTFDSLTKDKGFYTSLLGQNTPPVKLTSGPFKFGYPFKAKDSPSYILTIESATAYPNLYYTKNFKQFIQLTHLAPQASFNWYTTQLLRWTMFDGKSAEGVLFKPEDFDSSKRYPVIFVVYESYSEEINTFLRPGPSTGELNIPWFVSHGYLICFPDISYKVGEPGNSACNSVISCARYLSTMPWVDSNRIGLQGHSFGAYETNYIVTKTHLFAAASSAAGISDLTSMTFNLRYENGESADYFSEKDQNRLGATLWQDPGRYITNSPIYYADGLSTPILLMHNEDDGKVPWSQDVEWFTALRRLNKKVWMLQYKGEGHTLDKPENQLDYSRRLMQYFDTFLKDAPTPRWMADQDNR